MQGQHLSGVTLHAKRAKVWFWCNVSWCRSLTDHDKAEQHTGKVWPSSSTWSKPKEVTPHTIGLGMQLVASNRPPTPTSRIATSTFSSRNTFRAVTRDHDLKCVIVHDVDAMQHASPSTK